MKPGLGCLPSFQGFGAMPIIAKSTTIRSPLFIVTFLLLALIGCDQNSTHVVGTISEQGELRINPTEVSLDNGESLDLGLQRYYPDGRTSPASGQVTWSSSSPAVATVSTTGRVTARLPGQVTIRAQTSRETASATIDILPTNADLRLQVAEEIEIEAGANAGTSVGARVVDIAGNPIPGVHVDFRMDDAGEVLRQTTAADGYTHFEFEVGTEAGELEIEVSSPGLQSDAAVVTEGGEISASQGNGALRRVVKVNVRPSHPRDVHITPEHMSLEVDAWGAFQVKVVDNWGNPIDDVTFEWSLQRPEIAEIRPDGSVRGRAAGNSDVSVVASDASGRTASGGARIEVVPGESPAVNSLSIQGGQGQTGTVGAELPSALTVRAVNATGDAVPGVTVNWSVLQGNGTLSRSASTTDSGGIASVELTLGNSAGEVIVAAEAAGAPVRTFEVRAEAGKAAAVTLNPGTLVLEPGDSRRITAGASDAHGNEINAPEFVWTSSNPDVAVVNSEGRVTARTVGAVTVSAKVDGVTGTSEVEVGGASEPTSLHIARSSLDLTALGEEAHLEVSARNADGAAVDLPSSLTWTSSDSGVASVNSAGRVVANAVGTAVVAVAASCCTGDSVVIRVTQQVASVEVSPSERNLSIGDQLQFEARGYDSRGNPMNGLEIAWESLNSTIATVRADGVVTAQAAGQVQIRATSESRSGTAAITVETDSDGGDSGTTESPGEVADLRVASTTEGTVTLRFTEVSDGNGGAANYQIRYRDSGSFGNWGTAAVVRSGTCGDPVEGNAVGRTLECVVEGLAAGTDHAFRLVSSRTQDGSLVFGPLSNIAAGSTQGSSNGSGGGEADPASLHIGEVSNALTALGESVQLSLTAQNEDGNEANLPSTITWSSSDTNVATVDGSGRVIARAVGTALITVGAACCTGDEVAIQVTQEVAGVQVSPGSASLTPGTTRQFAAEAQDSNGHSISGASISWSSTNTSVASVSSSGVVVANSTGSATIRASSSGWMGQASVSVTSGGDSGTSAFPNEPAGYVTRFDDGFDYPGVTLNDPWFDVQGAGYGGRFNLGGRPSIVRANNGQPFSGPSAFRAFYPGGMPGGHDAARLSIPLSSQASGGFYLAYTVRLDPTWHTTANELGNGIKHVIPLVVPSDGSDVRPLGWTVIAQNPAGDNRYRLNYALENIPPETFRRHDIPYVNEQAALINKGEWAQVELLVQFDQAGQGTGNIQFFVNGTLVSRMDNAPIPVDRLRNLTIAGTYGGGIGNVPHDMWYDIGHFYVSGPAN